MRIYLIIVLSILFFSCKKEVAPNNESICYKKVSVKKNKQKQNLNISILLDLSDRIDSVKFSNPSMEYYQRDLGYIESITKVFESHLMNKKTYSINDKIQLFIDPEPSDRALNKKITNLKIQFDKKNATKNKIKQTSIKYKEVCTDIYNTAISDGKYIGSNIRGFFKNKMNDYCIDNKYRNIVIILTDGYIFHKHDIIKSKNKTSYLTPKTIKGFGLNTEKWNKKMERHNYGFLSIDKKLENIEVLVLGINPSNNNPYEGEVIKAYWSKWLTEMSIKKFQLKTADLPTHIDDVINNFILN